MKITIYRPGSIETFNSTILSYPDGILLEDDKVDYADLESVGILYSRAAFDTDPDTGKPYILKQDMEITGPNDLNDVLLITCDSKVMFIRNLKTGNLDNLLEASVEAMLEKYLMSLPGENDDVGDDHGSEDETDNGDNSFLSESPLEEMFGYDDHDR